MTVRRRAVALVVGLLALVVTGCWSSATSVPDDEFSIYQGVYNSSSSSQSEMGTPGSAPPPTEGVNAYPDPVSYSYLDDDIESALADLAYPGALALLLALGAVLAVALAKGALSRSGLVVFAAASAAAAVASEPGLETPVGSTLLRLAVVLIPALLAGAIRHFATGITPEG